MSSPEVLLQLHPPEVQRHLGLLLPILHEPHLLVIHQQQPERFHRVKLARLQIPHVAQHLQQPPDPAFLQQRPHDVSLPDPEQPQAGSHKLQAQGPQTDMTETLQQHVKRLHPYTIQPQQIILVYHQHVACQTTQSV